MDHDYPDTYDELPEGGPAGLGRQGRYDLFEEDPLYDRAASIRWPDTPADTTLIAPDVLVLSLLKEPPDWCLEMTRICTGRPPLVLPEPDDPEILLQVAPQSSGQTLYLIEGPQGRNLPPGSRTLDLRGLSAVSGPERLIAALMAAQHPARAQILAVVGARGALGVSTLVLGLARELASRLNVAIVDCDPGCPLGLLTGNDARPGLHWADLPPGEVVYRADRLVAGLPRFWRAALLTGDGRAGATVEQAQAAVLALAAIHDLVIIDLPRGQLPPPGAQVLLVTSRELYVVGAAVSLVRRLRGPAYSLGSQESGTQVRFLLRDVGEDLSRSEIEDLAGADILAQLPTDKALAQRAARGLDPTSGRSRWNRAVAALADVLLKEMGESASQYGDEL